MKKIEHLLAFSSLGLVALAGCGVLHTMHSDHSGQRGAAPSPPRITVAPLAFTQAPTSAQLAAHLCPLLATDAPLSTAASAGCRARGPAPADDDLVFRVRVETMIASTNPVRLRVSSVFLALIAYPDAGASQMLGTVCMTLCDAGATTCAQTNEACRSTDANIVDVADFSAAEDVVTSVAVSESHVEDLAVREVPAHGQVALSIDLALARAPLIAAIRANDTAAVEAIRAGRAPSFTIPYAIEGTVWVDGRGNDGFAEPIARTTGTLDIADP